MDSQTLELQFPDNFDSAPELDHWRCLLCSTGFLQEGNVEIMSLRQAVEHEQTPAHQAKAAAYDPWVPRTTWGDIRLQDFYSEMKVREKQQWVDQCPERISFWLKGVMAAQRGEEVENMQVFLDELDKKREEYEKGLSDGWGSVGWNNNWVWGGEVKDEVEQWQLPEDGWVQAGPKRKRGGRKTLWGKQGGYDVQGGSVEIGARHPIGNSNLSSLVEKFTQPQSANPVRKQKMNAFLKMPLDQKADKIQEMVHSLRT